MRRGLLSDLFHGVAVKRLTRVEVPGQGSNQHEFQGGRQLRELFGLEDQTRIPARFIRLSGEQDAVSDEGFLSWSNVRKGKPRAPEYHLYYSKNSATNIMQPGDTLFLAKQADGSYLAVITASGTTIENQISWLFDIESVQEEQFLFKELDRENSSELDFAARYILDELGLEPDDPDGDLIDGLIEQFGGAFPTTKIFSETARNSLQDVSAAEDPDLALVSWMEREEIMFRRLERVIVAERINSGFSEDGNVDVDGFLSFSLSVQNRRKSRAGHALENHLEAVLRAHEIRFARGAETENRNRPDFLFPGQPEYRDGQFPAGLLTMLGVKSSLKDRWRQVLSEAERVPAKHLLTLEPGISQNQTDEMAAKQLQLVIPEGLHETFSLEQQGWLLKVSEFLSILKEKQGRLPAINGQ